MAPRNSSCQLAQDAEALEPSAKLGSGLAVLRRKPVAQAAVRVPEAGVLDHLHRPEASLLQILQRGGRPLETIVVVGHHLAQKLAVFGLRLDRAGQLGHGGALHRPPARPCRGSRGRVTCPEQLERLPEAHPLQAHDPVQRASCGTTPKTMEEVLPDADDHRRGLLRVHRAEAHQVLGPVPAQLHPPRLSQPLPRHLALEPLNLLLGILAISQSLPLCRAIRPA